MKDTIFDVLTFSTLSVDNSVQKTLSLPPEQVQTLEEAILIKNCATQLNYTFQQVTQFPFNIESHSQKRS